ncbi:hypothetical protein OUZ56_016161 [Daphnia magna]|uniref:Uncharacterized protein n=1 Tax=Daphnia magna TaxID=35525 RepID=A0ABR0AQA0_9CRUS|nr:hypothetical protein OUZ56_016161 [Daphnia magna]
MNRRHSYIALRDRVAIGTKLAVSDTTSVHSVEKAVASNTPKRLIITHRPSIACWNMAIAGGKMNYQFIKWVNGASRPAPSSSPRQIRKFFCVKRNSSSYNAQLIIISVVELQQLLSYAIVSRSKRNKAIRISLFNTWLQNYTNDSTPPLQDPCLLLLDQWSNANHFKSSSYKVKPDSLGTLSILYYQYLLNENGTVAKNTGPISFLQQEINSNSNGILTILLGYCCGIRLKTRKASSSKYGKAVEQYVNED